MRYFCILLLFFLLNCQKKENILNEDYRYLEGKWRIKSQPFDFSPFDYDETKCSPDKNTIIKIKDNGEIIFTSKNCSFQKKYQISMDTFFEMIYKNKRLSYGITKENNNEINLLSGYFPGNIIKKRKIDLHEVEMIEKRGFEIELEKIKD